MHILIRTFYVSTCVLFFLSAQGQFAKQVSLAAAYTNFSSPGLSRNNPRKAYLFELEYQLSKHSIMSMNFQHGNSYYYNTSGVDNIIIDPFDNSFTNTNLYYSAAAFMYKYSFLPEKSSFRLSIGGGAAFTIVREDYLVKEEPFVFPLKYTSSFNTLSFPLRAEAAFKLTSFFHIGIVGGAYIDPDFKPAVMGYHFGPTVRYVIK